MTDWHLKSHSGTSRVSGPVLTVVMDGVGIGRGDAGDAVHLARTPTLDWLRQEAFYRELWAHGTHVGLPSDKDMGNSEVGHNALGAGRVFDQGAKLVGVAIESEELFRGDEWGRLIEQAKGSGEPVHFIGLLSDGNVHSHIDHLEAMIKRACADGAGVRVHALLDGRDVPESSALIYVERIEALLAELRGSGHDCLVASGGGRMTTTMDRYEADWSMVERGWNAHVHGKGRGFSSLEEAVKTFRAEDAEVTDQFLPSFVITDASGDPVGPIRDGAAVVFFNFRGDRAIEISRAFTEEEFTAFDRGNRPDVHFAGMMQYDGDLRLPEHFLVQPPKIDRTVGEYLAHARVTQFALSETQKYGHVTYFWNGNRSGKFDEKREEYLEITSDVLPFEQRPWMKSAEITDAVIQRIQRQSFRAGRINYANGDMVGHTGHLEAAIIAVETVDLALSRLLSPIRKAKGALIITADHGNADEMFERKGDVVQLDEKGVPRPKTSHTLNPVPLYIYAPGTELAPAAPISSAPKASGPVGSIAQVAATMLQLLGFERPEGYEPSLLS